MGSSKSKPEQTPADTIPSNTQKKLQVVTKTKQQPKSPQQQIISDKQISNIYNSVTSPAQPQQTSFIEGCIKTLDTDLTPLLTNAKSQYNAIHKQYVHPLNQSYKEIPEAITAIKFTYLNCYGYSDRLTALGLASMIAGVASFRNAKVYQLPLRTFAAFKDATLAYFVGGLIIAPEIFNPLMNS